ncbi:MAG: single-stranded DNA-binding protein [Verrucomicrobia bacterium]|nr:single-stranded DNA-binding protein [Verrucomicrobiota bacterium]
MASFNKVILMGNLTRDPERRYTPKGTAVTEFAIAVNRVYSNEGGEQKEEVSYFDIVVWGRQAETAAQYLSKGRPALVEGRLQQDRWESDKGEKRSKIRVVADRVVFLGSGQRGGGQEFREGGPAPERAERAPAEPPAVDTAPEAPAAGREKDDIPF